MTLASAIGHPDVVVIDYMVIVASGGCLLIHQFFSIALCSAVSYKRCVGPIQAWYRTSYHTRCGAADARGAILQLIKDTGAVPFNTRVLLAAVAQEHHFVPIGAYGRTICLNMIVFRRA